MNPDKYARDKASIISMIRFILMVGIIALVCLLATKIVIILIPFLIGYLLARTSLAISSPLIKNIKSDTKGLKKKKRIVTIVYYLLLLATLILAIIIIYELIGQGAKAVNNLTNFALSFDPGAFYDNLLGKFSNHHKLIDIIDNYEDVFRGALSNITVSISEKVPGVISGLISSIWNTLGDIPYWIFVIVCVIMSGHYFINDNSSIIRFSNRLIPNKSFRAKVFRIVNNLSTTLFRALGGYIILFAITTIEAYITLKIAGINYATILAIIAGAVDFLPVLGVSATLVPVIIYCIFHGDFIGAIIVIIGLAVITVVRRLIEPPILGKSLHLHPLLMLISMAAGVYIWGAIGFLLGPTVTIIILDILKTFEFDKKILDYVSNVLENFIPHASKNKKSAATTTDSNSSSQG